LAYPLIKVLFVCRAQTTSLRRRDKPGTDSYSFDRSLTFSNQQCRWTVADTSCLYIRI